VHTHAGELGVDTNGMSFHEGMHLLVSIGQTGVITGYGFGLASSHDQHLLEPFLAVCSLSCGDLPTMGKKTQAVYIADKGFAGDKPHKRWRELFDAEVITAPHQRSKYTWPKEWRR